MTFRQAVKMLKKAGIPYRSGSGDHVVFYPPHSTGTIIVPLSNKECTKQMKMVLKKCLEGRSTSRSGYPRKF